MPHANNGAPYITSSFAITMRFTVAMGFVFSIEIAQHLLPQTS